MKVTVRAQERWDAIVEKFRSACILHRNGKEWESRRIIKEELPPLIKQWMQLLPAGLKEDAKADLRDMFTREQSVVDQGHKLQRLFKETLVKRIIPQVEARIASKYRSIYVSKMDERRAKREDEIAGSWIKPSYSEAPKHPMNFGTGDKRIKLGDISEMIDALQETDHESLAESLISLDDIVEGMNEAKIDPLLNG